MSRRALDLLAAASLLIAVVLAIVARAAFPGTSEPILPRSSGTPVVVVTR